MRRARLALGLVILAACGSSHVPASGSSTPAGHVNPLLGDWRWTRSCDAVFQDFDEANLTDRLPRALVDARYFANEDQIRQDDPCVGAEETAYLYFFEVPGRWGVIDEDDVLVEDRTYEVVDEDTISFVDIEVDHRVEGDTLTFDVRRPATCDPACLETYVWALARFAPATLERAD
jgi:hypothetical protein